MTSSKQTPSIKLELDVKNRLDNYKKNGTYTMVIESFLNYFEITGIKPSDLNLSPVSLIKSYNDRVIKILRNIELKKIDPQILMTETILNHLKNGTSIQKESGVTDEEAQGLIDKIGILETQLKNKDIEVRNLNDKLSKAPSVSAPNKNLLVLQEIKKYIIEIDNNKTSSKLKLNEWSVEKNLFTRNIETIINLINNEI